MSGWKALNIESDDDSDIEVDDTKELQIEDALKLYQTALKYHAAGPDSYELAADAYSELFRSEIFQYPESQIELRRIELYGPLVEGDDLWQEDFSPEVVAVSGSADTGPSTLPQILHLSHKNYAQFKLEYLAARLDVLHLTLAQILSDATIALDHFVEALDKDDTDLDLWRRTASVGQILDNKRVARFCLDAVLDGEDEAVGNALSLPGLDEGLAGEQLRSLVGELQDELSVLQSPLLHGKRKPISSILKKRLDSYSKILDEEQSLKAKMTVETRHPHKIKLKTPTSWEEVGELLLRQAMAEQHGTSSSDPAAVIAFHTDSMDLEMSSPVTAPSPQLQIEASPVVLATMMFPKTIADQYPGLDDGRPTTQPRIAPADAEMATITNSPAAADIAMEDGPSVSLPTRKRSGDAAGLQDGVEEGRTKSKRTRVRESTTAEENRQAINAQWEFEQQLSEIQAADDWMFDTVGNLFERVGIVGFEVARNVRQEVQPPQIDLPPWDVTQQESGGLKGAKSDLHAFLASYSDQQSNAFLAGNDNLEFGQGSKVPGMNGAAASSTIAGAAKKPAPMPNDDLHRFISDIHNGWYMTQEVAWRWVCTMLRPAPKSDLSSYLQYQWSETLKTMVVRNLVNFDAHFVHTATTELEAWQKNSDLRPEPDTLVDMLESLFELHLDIYCLIKEPQSGVDATTVLEQRDRLQRWSQLAREAMHFRSLAKGSSDFGDSLSIRFMWATTFYLGASSDVTQDHVIECMNDLRAILMSIDDSNVQLQNNAIMPELSIAALDREISKLTTKDFFLKVTTQDEKDPVATIENLEPLLMALQRDSMTYHCDNDQDLQEPSESSPDLVRFLQSTEISVRMLLWRHLRDAYLAIDYKPMVVSCHFNMIKFVLAELKSKEPSSGSQIERQAYALKTLSIVQNIISQTWIIIQKASDAFECVDETLMKEAVSSLGEVLQLLQVFNVLFDSIRIGQSQPPTLPNGSTALTFDNFKGKIDDMQVHTWLILYSLLKEATFQFHEVYPTPAEDMFDFLRAVHRNLGLRGICGNLNKIFVRTLKDEFVQMTHIDGYDSEQAQVLYDLYGLNCFLNSNYELIEHQCQHDAFIEKSIALQAVDLLLLQASKLPMKDLIKHPIKDTIEKVHGAAPRKKPTEPILRNRDIYRAFLKSPINPLDLFNCLKGEGSYLTTSHVPREDAVLASKGWYFLMGHIALAKFRSVKRSTQSQTEDVDIAIAFFMQDLEFSMYKWETWFRLAQAYDTKIEESIVWSAEKLNNSMPEIVQLQRSAIHCYIMATALAYRSADLVDETSEKMTDLYIEFGQRLYASSREPFSMQPFLVDDQEKFLSIPEIPGVSTGRPFKPLRMYTTWKLAKVLLQRGMKNKAQPWMIHFVLGKCLWKMHAASHYVRSSNDVPPSAQEVLSSFIKAIETIPDERRKDSREKREPVLEPHYKLVSIVHKMVSRGSISLEEAKEALTNTPYARSSAFPEEQDEWVPYVLSVLKTLRAADKSNWHHRMIARAAQIIHDDSDPRADSMGSHSLGAMGAKHELTQQMFTKTMVLQVWRPDSERAGRHFVYTARYTRFFLQILEQLKDRSNLEQLAKRVRKRLHDIFEHSAVWSDICSAYLRLLRSHAAIAEGLETSTFSNIAHEDFLLRKEQLEKWMQNQDKGSSTALDVLREVQDLKKLNQSLMKPGPIDDLIGDAYAYLFNTIAKALWEDQQRIKREDASRPPPPPATSPARNPMMSLTHLMNVDGANDVPVLPTPPPAAVASANSQPDQPTMRRKMGVGRREIRTCAEGCFQKSQTSNVVGSASTRPPASYPRVQVVIETSGALPGDASVDTSAPGSIHDSADDESELSELEEEGDDDEDGDAAVKEEERPRLMFPGLASAAESREASEGFVTAAEEETENAEGDVEMGEDEPSGKTEQSVSNGPMKDLVEEG